MDPLRCAVPLVVVLAMAVHGSGKERCPLLVARRFVDHRLSATQERLHRVRVAVEAGIRMGWDKYIGSSGKFVGMSSFGASAGFGRHSSGGRPGAWGGELKSCWFLL